MHIITSVPDILRVNISRVVIILDRWMSVLRVVRPRHEWENNIKMGLQEIALFFVDLIDLAQYRDR
jgi:hypothetical protein